MPDPPVLYDKSFQRAIGGREFQLYYSARACRWSPARPRPELLGREHAARLALERDDDRDREGSQAASGEAAEVESSAWPGGHLRRRLGRPRDGGLLRRSRARRGDPRRRPGKDRRAEARRGAVPRARHPGAPRAQPRRLTFTLDIGDLVDCPFLFVCVDTPPTRSGDADLSRVWNVIDALPELPGAPDSRHEVDGARRDWGEGATRARRARDDERRLRVEPRVPRRGDRRARLHAARPDRDRRRRRGGRRRRRRALRRHRGPRSFAATSTRRRCRSSPPTQRS